MSIEEQPVEDERTNETTQQLLVIVQKYMALSEVEKVTQALWLVQNTYQGVRGKDLVDTVRTSPLEHALAIATILAQNHIDADGVVAGIVFEAVYAKLLPLKQTVDMDIESVESVLGSTVARIVSSMVSLNILEQNKQAGTIFSTERSEGETDFSREQKKRRIHEALRRQQAETVRKMFFAMAEDPHVVLLKLAYRLHTMRMICSHTYPADQQEMVTMAQETREIYAPLAGRLGMSRIENELEDLAFEILEPEKHAWVRNQVNAKSTQLSWLLKKSVLNK